MFIVIEGIDGAGCETQGKLVFEKLQQSKKKPSFIKFPHYDTPVGKMIKDFLYQNQKMKAHEQFLLYTLQFIFDEEEIRQKLQKGSLVADRYFTTTLCYQTVEGFDEQVALRYADDFGIIKPDMVFFLDVKPETAIKWKYGEDKEKNFREKDFEFMKKSYERYQDLVKRHVWTRWIAINGTQTKEKVCDEILSHLV